MALAEALEANRDGIPALVDVEIEPHHYHPHFERIHRGRLDH
jgi:acetolactate synthase I/II/III large subunit